MNKSKKISLIVCLSISLLLFAILFTLIIAKNEALFKIDDFVAQTFFNHRTRLLDHLFVIISYMGETITIVVLCIILLLLPNRKQIGIPVVILTIISFSINFVLKIIVARHRPENLFLTQETLGYKMPDGYSFPSGHAQTSNLFYFALSFMFLNNIKQKWKRVFLIVLTTLFCLFMCLARIYLGVHFLGDVICGLSIMIAIFCGYFLIQEKLLKNKYSSYE